MKPWAEYTFVGFDTETTGKFPLVAEIVEVAGVKWRNGQVIDTFQSLVKPKEKMGDFVISIHHITNEMVVHAPVISDVLPQFEAFIKDSILIAHHAPFDMGFLALEYEKLKIPLPESKVICTCLLSQKTNPKSTNHRLATLVALFGVKVDQAHRALADSRACLEVGLKCMEAVGPQATLEDIYKAQGGGLDWNRHSMKDLLQNETTRNIVEAASKQLVLEITYQGGSNPGQPRNITPQGLVRNPIGDYVVGLCHRENREKRYYLNRILTAKILD